MSEKTISIQNRIRAARTKSFNFDQIVKLCDTKIQHFVENIKKDNDKPTTNIHMPATPSQTRVNILLPMIPMSPNEIQLLLEYLDDKYIEGDGEPVVGGNYFCIRKCFFKNNYQLTTRNYNYGI